MQDPSLSRNLHINAAGNLAVKGQTVTVASSSQVSRTETAAATVTSAEPEVGVTGGEAGLEHPYLSFDQAAVLVTALAVASEQSLDYGDLPVPSSTEGQPELSL